MQSHFSTAINETCKRQTKDNRTFTLYLFCALCDLDTVFARTRVIESNSTVACFIVIYSKFYRNFQILFISQSSLLRLPAVANLAHSLTQ